jgi:hypothetical protein
VFFVDRIVDRLDYLFIVFSHRRRDDPTWKEDVDRACCFVHQQSRGLCDRIAHVAARLYPGECVLHLHNRIQPSGMVKGAEKSIRIDL